MAASYPSAIKTWSPSDTGFFYPEDLKTIVYARHVTSIYDEVTAMQTELGSGGLKTSIPNQLTAFDGSLGKDWGSLKARLANLEQGVLDGVTKRVSTLGGTEISSSSTTVGLSIKTSGSGNLLELRNTSNQIVNRFGSDGFLYGVIDGGTVS